MRISLIPKYLKSQSSAHGKNLIISNLFWSVLGKFVNLLSGLLVGVIVARYLGPERYGLMNYVISFVFLFQTFSTFGLDSIEIREESRGKISHDVIIGTAFYVKVFSGIIFMLLSVGTSFLLSDDSETVVLVFIYSFSIVLNAFNVIRNYFMARVQNEYVVKTEIFRSFLGMGIKFLLYLLGMPLIWFVVAYMFDYFLLGSGYCMAYRKMFGKIKDWSFNYEYAKYLLKESFPLMLTSAAVIVYQRIDQVMIGQMVDNTAVGYFSVASRFVEILLYIPMTLSQTITPVLVRTLEEDVNLYKAKAQRFMNLSLWMSLLVSVATSLLAPFIVDITFGDTYTPAVVVLQIMSFKAASVALSNTAGAMLVSERLQKFAIGRDLLGCAVCVSLNYIFLPKYGIIAAAFIAIASNVAAGFIADALIPAFRHIFFRQIKAILYGWKDLIYLKTLLTTN